MAAKHKVVVVTSLVVTLLGASCGPLDALLPGRLGLLPTLFTWTNGEGMWSEPANWDIQAVPTAGSSVLIDGASAGADPPVIVTLDVFAQLNTLTLLNGAELQAVGFVTDETIRVLEASSLISNPNGIIRATMAGQFALTAPTIDQGGLGQGGLIAAVDLPGAVGVPLTVVQIGMGAADNEVQLQGGELRTEGDHDVILLTTGVTVSNVRVETLRTASGAGREPAGCLDLNCEVGVGSGVVVPDGEVVKFRDTVENYGRVTISAANLETRLEPVGSAIATLEGDGRLQMTHTDLAILGVPRTLDVCAKLTPTTVANYVNGKGHRIGGAGLIYGDLENLGAIIADEASQKLRLECGTFFNYGGGRLSAENGGELLISGAFIDQTKDAMIIAEADSQVTIQDMSTISGEGNAMAIGGILEFNGVIVELASCFNGPPPGDRSSNVGSINIQNGSTVTLQGAAEISGGIFDISNSDLISAGGLQLAAPVSETGMPVGEATILLLDSTLVTGPATLDASATITVFNDSQVQIAESLRMTSTNDQAPAKLEAENAVLFVGSHPDPAEERPTTDFVEVEAVSGFALLDMSTAASARLRTLEVYTDGQIRIEGKVVVRDRYTFTVNTMDGGNPDEYVQWLDGSELRFESPSTDPNTCATLEVGSVPGGSLENDFGLNCLFIASGVKVKLVNEHANTVGTNPGDENLSLQNFEIFGELDCNGINVDTPNGVDDPCSPITPPCP